MLRFTRPKRRLRVASAVVVTAILIVAAVFLADRDVDWTSADADRSGQSEIEELVMRQFDAARSGDVDAWRAAYAGVELERINAQVAAVGRDEFAVALKSEAVSILSCVTSGWTIEDEDEASMLLELIYADRNRKCRLLLKKTNGRWRITERAQLDEFAPEIPYGTPVVPDVSDDSAESD